ncbi:MAG: hypothetical protein ABIO70_13130 [Pseudomonadota bacterium]
MPSTRRPLPGTLLVTGLIVACGGPPPPDGLDGVAPALVCDEQGSTTLTLTGAALQPAVAGGLTGEPGVLYPALSLEPAGGLAEGEPATGAGAVLLDPSRLEWQAPDTVTLRVDGTLGLSRGCWDLVAATPTGATARLAAALAVADPPSLWAATPTRVCHDDEGTEVLVGGADFLLLGDGTLPAVSAGGVDSEVLGGDGCAPLAGGIAGQVCAGLRVRVPSASLPLGLASISVQNPAPAACVSLDPLAVEVVLPPEVAAVSPALVCESGGLVEVSGGPFVEGTAVEIDGVPVEAVALLDTETLQVRIGADSPLGPTDLTVIDPSGCQETLEAALEVVPAPQVFHVDPPVVPAGRALVATALLADLRGELTDAWLVEEASGDVREVGWSWSAEEPERLRLSLPDDLAEGGWQVAIEEIGQCPGLLSAAFEVVSAPTVSIAGVDPGQAWTFDHTPVDIRTADPIPSGQVGFEDVPQVYLLPPEGEARQTLAVRFHDRGRLTAVVPPELEAGAWDLLVVNPDGAWGLLPTAIEVTWEAPPTITSVSPATLATGSGEIFVVRGRDFRDPTVALTCQSGGVEVELAAVVEGWTFSSIAASVSTRGLGGSLCLVTVTDDDGAIARYSAISITNPAQNLFPFEAGTDMTTARRAPAAAAGRITSVNRAVYAIGGDAGDPGTALDSVERAEVDPWGELSAWAALPDPLPEPRTLAGAVTVGRFVVLVGGDDGAGPLASVRRAQILDPLEVPWPESVALDSREHGGLAPGRWSYRVAALFDGAFEANPGGQSLAGEPLSVTLPDSRAGWAVALCWSAVEGAAGYRLFRGAEPDAPSGEVAWLMDVGAEGLCFQDEGDAVEPSVVPLPDGALGAWAALAELNEARAAPCVAVAADPRLDPEAWHLYAAGGLDTSGQPLDSIEALQITVELEDFHSAGVWEVLPERLSEARARCGGYTVDERLHTVVDPGESWVIFAGGETATHTVGTLDVGRVEAGGALSDWDTGHDLTPARAGFGLAAASDFLYAFGGSQGQPSDGGVSGALEAGAPLDVHNWNSLGTSLSEPRYLPGAAQESAVIFVLGGQTSTAAATSSTDLTHY